MTEIDRAIDALRAISADLPRAEWVRAGMAAQAAGVSFDTFDAWSAGGRTYNAKDTRAAWHSFKPNGRITGATLFKLAADHGRTNGHDKPQRSRAKAPIRAVEAPRKPAPGVSAGEVWARGVAATYQHPYLEQKRAAGVPLHDLRVLPEGDQM
ncbi:MAG: PriCT-2 domain-containing protein, partial [Burkholderiaceae bacterium]|nr:PriCT-2 domain-containing protein [Burkholderiaceae bacterium]